MLEITMPIHTDSDRSSQVLSLTRRNRTQQIRWHRHLHQHPELSYQEHTTTSYLRRTLDKMGLKLLPLKMETGVLAELRGSGSGPVVAVRSDIDALPIGERSGVPCASKTEGCMHACGHDIHMATVLGVAWVLKKMAGQFPGRVRFLFQPAEEMPPGGALPMIKNGALKDVAMILGLHVDPHLPTGQIGLRDGITMASVLDFDLRVIGRAGHGARPQDAVDAITTAAEIIESMQKVISREIDPVAPAAITFGKIEGGLARNVIAEEVLLTGTARSLSVEVARSLPQKIKRTAQAIARAHGARCEMEVIGEYPLFDNDPTTNAVLRRSFEALYPRGRVALTPQVLGGEDFARYLEKVPGAMFRLGIRNRKIKADKPWHSPLFVADEAALEVGTAVLATALLDRLTEER
jgi:amidohydrolase